MDRPPPAGRKFYVHNGTISAKLWDFMKMKCVTWLKLLTVAGVLGGAAASAAEPKISPPPPPPAATAPAPEAGVPKIEFGSMAFDFGKVKSGEVVRHDYVFTNIGTATLEISDVRPSCGCTTAGTWEKRIEPGKSGTIPLQFNSAAFGGQVSKSATVICNDPGKSNLVLQLTGTVWKPIDVNPPTAVFTISSDAQTNETKVVRIVSNLEEPITLSEVQSSNHAFQAEIKIVKPGKEFELLVTAVPPFATPTIYAPITVKSSSTEMPLVTVNAYLTVQEPVVVAPNAITLPPGPLAAPSSSMLTIRNNGTNAMVLSDASVNVEDAAVRMQEPQPGRFFSLTVDFPAGFRMKPDQKVEVSVKSNHPKYPLIKVPVFQMQLPAAPTAQAGTNTLEATLVREAASQPEKK